MRNQNKSAVRMLLVLFAGSLVGAVLSMLLAPESGERTRRRLRVGFLRFQKKAMEMADVVEEKTRELIDELVDDVRAELREGADQIDELKDRYEE